ncbi:carboxypeptidase-like regulatory domain-containing protein [Flavobacterium franklandianum]|uniref:Carboxypeptidase-like regulatory domain-containing protein n=1 Tax=Flavobacterium franklandianum TaxID=2594430 RepID=A0A553CLE9_9FLAO|nr:carboxypeptidase-like regulatory domain-containing protein [Flavobacterium franklandianum]TRX21336.1 carboxypeptidase-like regulatory domain-containing protein [Flavobacterium franklandianum]TRX30022.1 carboxypeptidase-like regulatory domain-containing protein [Flavobacterium franklandianum]
MKYIYILFLAFFFNAQSQNILVLDSLNHKPIPFVNIILNNNNNGTYTNESGYFEVNKKLKDTLFFSHISYNSIQVKASEIKDTIILSPNAILLKEVKISNGKQQTKFIDFPKKNSSYGSWPVTSMSEIVTLIIPNLQNEDSKIKKLEFNFVKRKLDEFKSNLRTAFRINIYSSKKGEIDSKIYSSDACIINAYNKEKIEIDLGNENIELNKKGIFIGIEVIGDIDENGNLSKEMASIRPVLSDNSINDYTATTFLKYIFDKKQKLKPLNEIFSEKIFSKISRNLSFGMTISKLN